MHGHGDVVCASPRYPAARPFPPIWTLEFGLYPLSTMVCIWFLGHYPCRAWPSSIWPDPLRGLLAHQGSLGRCQFDWRASLAGNGTNESRP
jgi:hypothetical protein